MNAFSEIIQARFEYGAGFNSAKFTWLKNTIKEIRNICELECKNECMNMAECKLPYCESLQGRILRVIGD